MMENIETDISQNKILLELVSVALEGVLDDLNNVDLSDHGAVSLSREMRLLNKAHKALTLEIENEDN
jgi:hypothetical protein